MLKAKAKRDREMLEAAMGVTTNNEEAQPV
jgi:hypothetical protein